MADTIVFADKPETVLRKSPKRSAKAVNHVLMGTWLKVVDVDDDWFKVETRKAGKPGPSGCSPRRCVAVEVVCSLMQLVRTRGVLSTAATASTTLKLERIRIMTATNNHNTVGTQQEMRRRLLHYVVQHLDESVINTAVDGLLELLSLPLCDEMVEELLFPIFNWSDFWPQYMAKQILGLPTDDEYGWEELLEHFEAQDGGKAGQNTHGDQTAA